MQRGTRLGRRPGLPLRVARIALGLTAVTGLYLYLQGDWTPGAAFSNTVPHQGPLDLAEPGASRSVGALSAAEEYHLRQQRTLVDDLARRHVGTGIEGGALGDLRVLQDLLDRDVLEPGATYELQALGVAMGDVLAKQLGLHWVAVTDDYGRSRALAGGDSATILFPVTMISRLVEAGIEVDVQQRYGEAAALYRAGARAAP